MFSSGCFYFLNEIGNNQLRSNKEEEEELLKI